MKFFALAYLFTALVGAIPAEAPVEALEERDALPGGGGHHKACKTVYKTVYVSKPMGKTVTRQLGFSMEPHPASNGFTRFETC